MSKAMQKKKAPSMEPFRKALQAALPHFSQALPETARKTMTPERISKLMLSAMSRNPKLLECTPESVLKVCMESASLALEPQSPLGHLYAVPYWNSKNGAMEAQPIIGYRGLIALARRSGEITSIDAEAVRERDHFVFQKGLDPKLEHRPALDGKDPGPVIAAYAIAKFKDGGFQIDVMSRAQIDAIRGRSKSPKSGPWETDFDEMARKTVVRRAAKYWPMSTELARGLEMDDEAESDLPPIPDNIVFDGGPLEDRSVTAKAADELPDWDEGGDNAEA